MVLGGTALKIASLAIKTLAKPVAKQFRSSAEKSDFWRRIFMGYAQWHHRIEYQITVRLLGHHAREVKALDEKKAVSFGSEVLSEFFIFSVAAGVVVFEYSRSQIANAQKKALEEQMIQDKEHQLETRFLEIESRILGLASEQERTRLAISESMADVLHELQELKNKDKQGSR